MFFLAAPSVVLCDIYQYLLVPVDGGKIDTIKLCGWQDDHIVELFVCGEKKTIQVRIRETRAVKDETITAGSLLRIQIPPGFQEAFNSVFKDTFERKCLPQILSDIESALKNYHHSEDVQIGVDQPLYEKYIEITPVDWSGYGVERGLPKEAQPQRRGTRSSAGGKRARSESLEPITPILPLVGFSDSSHMANLIARQDFGPFGSLDSPLVLEGYLVSELTPIAKPSPSTVRPDSQLQPKVEDRSVDGEG